MQTHTRTIAAPGTHEIVVKKSRFLCTLIRAGSEDDARAAIDDVRRRHWNANHNCSAYRLGPGGHLQRTSDDGEPAGTAGAPMLAALTRRDLTDTVAVVTRYFGGVLLGTGGLVRAYSQAVSAAIDAVGVVEIRPVTLIAVDADYADGGRLEHALRGAGFALGPVTHADRVTFEVRLDEPNLLDFEAWLGDVSNGRSRVRVVGHTHTEVPVTAGD